MPVTVVIGAQWGDEGKGKVTDVHAERVDVVARFQGGNNAGHTVIAEGVTYKFQLLPSGVVHPRVKNVLGNGLVVDPAALLQELESLRQKGKPNDHVFVSDRAQVILPWHRQLDGAKEKTGNAVGTTKKGIGPSYADKVARAGLRMGDLLDEKRLRERLTLALAEKQALYALHGLEDKTSLDIEALVQEYAGYGRALAPRITDTVTLLNDAVDAGQRVLLEGAQGTFLDIDHGTYPYVTSSNTTSGGACTGTGIPPTKIDSVIGIVKAYTTRVGSGPFVTELPYETPEGKHMTDVGREVGTVTGRRRRCGWLDLVLLRRAARVNGFTEIAFTKLDVLGGLPKILVCEAYDIDGRTVKEFPSNPEELARAKPIYTEYAGFPAFDARTVKESATKGLEALPKAARHYVESVEASLKVPITMVGTGPEREATIHRHR
ncbi:MAG TPA: adenylosuccinate synthase [Candidatus Thermoplasmatota archaeon]|nr:adenylosuccinate synthase [Candidatus Thermoplasmatota archaeon]